MDNQIPIQTHVRCGACQVDNVSEARFCADCGQSLHEKCGFCGKSVLLTQSFCGDCGADLNKALQTRHLQHRQWMEQAVSHAKESEYERAISLLGRIAELTDYRFKQAAADAATAMVKVEALRNRAQATIESVTKRALDAAQRGDQYQVLQHLNSVPAKLLSEDARKLLARAQVFSGEWTELEASVRSAIASKNWLLVGKCVQQLLTLAPHQATYEKLAIQISGKLVAVSKRMIDEGQYEAAVNYLDAIPDVACDKTMKRLREEADELHWLSEQFDAEPYATPTLGRLAVRLAKATPNNPRTQKLGQQLSHQLKQGKRATRMHLPDWKGSRKSWLGGDVGVLGLPTSIKFGKQPEFMAAAGRLNVALGLAIQGLGKSRIKEDFLVKKRGLLSLGKRKSNACWGVDVGASAIKAVLLKEANTGFEVVDVFICELEVPLCRREMDLDGRTVLKSGIDKFLEQTQRGDVPIWVNLGSTSTVNRFVLLPPVKDREAKHLLMREMEGKTPIPMDELEVVSWIHPFDRDAVLGRPAVACTARRSIVVNRTDLIESCGLKVSGMQCDNLALANFAAHEFSSLWLEAGSTTVDDSDTRSETMSKAVVIIDCGASSTNILLVSGEAHWSWSVEIGAEDFTSQIARSAKTTHWEAEKLKRNPAALASPANQYQPVERRLEELRSRLKTVFADAMKQDTKFKATQTWCMGGGRQTHQWIRRVLLESGATQ